MMSDKEILRACELRLEGKSWDEIGAELHYDGSGIRNVVKNRIMSMTTIYSTGLHPYVKHWMRSYGVTGKQIAERAGICNQSVTNYLNKRHIPEKCARVICEMSGLTMEQVQATKEDHHG